MLFKSSDFDKNKKLFEWYKRNCNVFNNLTRLLLQTKMHYTALCKQFVIVGHETVCCALADVELISTLIWLENVVNSIMICDYIGLAGELSEMSEHVENLNHLSVNVGLRTKFDTIEVPEVW